MEDLSIICLSLSLAPTLPLWFWFPNKQSFLFFLDHKLHLTGTLLTHTGNEAGRPGSTRLEHMLAYAKTRTEDRPIPSREQAWQKNLGNFPTMFQVPLGTTRTEAGGELGRLSALVSIVLARSGARLGQDKLQYPLACIQPGNGVSCAQLDQAAMPTGES